MLGTDLASVSTHGWFTEPSVLSELTPISTFGWYYTESAILTPVSILYSLPIEYLQGIGVNNPIPIEIIRGISTEDGLDQIPIEILGEEQRWVLNFRGIRWVIEDCGDLWLPKSYGNIWRLDERE